MKNLLVITAVAATLSITACASNAPAEKMSAYDTTVSEAMKLHESAKSHHHVFKQKKMKQPYVEHHLSLAKEAKAKNDDQTAMFHAKEALKIAKAEMTQYEEGKTIKPGWVK